MPFWKISGLGPRNSALITWSDDLEKKRAISGENMCPTSLTPPTNCELDWSMQRHADDRGRRLIASVDDTFLVVLCLTPNTFYNSF